MCISLDTCQSLERYHFALTEHHVWPPLNMCQRLKGDHLELSYLHGGKVSTMEGLMCLCAVYCCSVCLRVYNFCMCRMVRLLSILPARKDISQLLTFCFKLQRQMSVFARRYEIHVYFGKQEQTHLVVQPCMLFVVQTIVFNFMWPYLQCMHVQRLKMHIMHFQRLHTCFHFLCFFCATHKTCPSND